MSPFRVFFATLLVFVILTTISILIGSGAIYFSPDNNTSTYDTVRHIFLGTLAFSILTIIVISVGFILNKYRFLKNPQPGQLTLKQWFYNLIPFRPIDVLIHQAYPNEKIISKRFCYDSVLVMTRIIPFPTIHINFPFPARVIETDKSYYTDRLVILALYFVFKIDFLSTARIYVNAVTLIVISSIMLLPVLFWQVLYIHP